MQIDRALKPADLVGDIETLWSLSGAKIRALETDWSGDGAPVHTRAGRWASQAWTDWTEGFRYGSMLLQFDATDETEMLELGRRLTIGRMPVHLTHSGVHDHGFNTVSTYGALLRLMDAGRVRHDPWERETYRTAIMTSGAVQALRWTPLGAVDGTERGFVHSFNGPHSLFIDTMRTLRVMALAHALDHRPRGEGDAPISLLGRLLTHARTTAATIVYFGEGRDIYDARGRVAHEGLFNTVSGAFRSPATQQGYSGYSTWTRGLSWAMLGYAELLEHLAGLDPAELEPHGGREAVLDEFRAAAAATCDFYVEHTASDGIPYWDTGAPELHRLGDWRARPAEPDNDFEPVDSSAAAIGAQGLVRLGLHLGPDTDDGARHLGAGLTVLRTLLSPAYLSRDEGHHGLVLHSQYHRPNGWDHVPDGARIPRGEATAWGDYHARELALVVQRLAGDGPVPAFDRVRPGSDLAGR